MGAFVVALPYITRIQTMDLRVHALSRPSVTFVADTSIWSLPKVTRSPSSNCLNELSKIVQSERSDDQSPPPERDYR